MNKLTYVYFMVVDHFFVRTAFQVWFGLVWLMAYQPLKVINAKAILLEEQ